MLHSEPGYWIKLVSEKQKGPLVHSYRPFSWDGWHKCHKTCYKTLHTIQKKVNDMRRWHTRTSVSGNFKHVFTQQWLIGGHWHKLYEQTLDMIKSPCFCCKHFLPFRFYAFIPLSLRASNKPWPMGHLV